MKTKKIALCLVFLFLLAVFIPMDVRADTIIGSGVIFKAGNANFTTSHSMIFSDISVVGSPAYLWLNTTRLCITPVSSYVTVNLSYLSPHPLVSVANEKILGFNATKATGRVWFNFTGLKTNYWYKYRNDSSPFTLVLSNGSGGVNFSFIGWSKHDFGLYDAGVSGGSTGGGLVGSSNRVTSFFLIGVVAGVLVGGLILNNRRKKKA